MPASTLWSRALARLGALVAGVVAVGLIGLPTAHAINPTANLVLAAGQSGSIGTVATNTNVTPVPTCDPELSVSFDATMAGTVLVAPDAALGLYTCSVDYQVSGQSIGLIEQVSVQVVPGLSINDVSVHEGNVGVSPGTVSMGGITIPPTPATFTVTMSEPSTTPVTVQVASADGTAVAPSDYASLTQAVTFAPGQTSATVTVDVHPDDNVEPDETYSVNLSAPTGAAIVDGQGVGTILNDDQGPIRL